MNVTLTEYSSKYGTIGPGQLYRWRDYEPLFPVPTGTKVVRGHVANVYDEDVLTVWIQKKRESFRYKTLTLVESDITQKSTLDNKLAQAFIRSVQTPVPAKYGIAKLAWGD